MRISDWSSDVCSSDLEPFLQPVPPYPGTDPLELPRDARHVVDKQVGRRADQGAAAGEDGDVGPRDPETLGRKTQRGGYVANHRRAEQDRQRGVAAKTVSVRLNPRGRQHIKKKK